LHAISTGHQSEFDWPPSFKTILSKIKLYFANRSTGALIFENYLVYDWIISNKKQLNSCSATKFTPNISIQVPFHSQLTIYPTNSSTKQSLHQLQINSLNLLKIVNPCLSTIFFICFLLTRQYRAFISTSECLIECWPWQPPALPTSLDGVPSCCHNSHHIMLNQVFWVWRGCWRKSGRCLCLVSRCLVLKLVVLMEGYGWTF
jgi:hypothetical protein